MRANRLLKPDRHECCANASHLGVWSVLGTWMWRLKVAGVNLPVTHCPWCGEQLPNERAKPRLGVVR